MEFKKGLLKTIGPVLVTAVALSACQMAGPRPTYNPYPTTRTSAQQYNRDLMDCQAWAASQPGASPQRALNRGAQGAVGLGLLGAVLGALAGDAKIGGLAGASIGAVGGAMQGSQQAQEAFNRAYENCLKVKGY